MDAKPKATTVVRKLSERIIYGESSPACHPEIRRSASDTRAELTPAGRLNFLIPTDPLWRAGHRFVRLNWFG